MSFTWGFLVLFILLIIPGLIIRRLYYYGEFSKQFGYSQPLTKVLAYSLIPGLVNLVWVSILFDWLFVTIDFGYIIDGYKTFTNPLSRYKEIDGPPLRELFSGGIMPFLGSLYGSAFFIGASSGRLVRISGIDTKWKLLRFNNIWFYAFNHHIINIKKYKHLKLKRKDNKFLFTSADVLIDTNSGTQLYSGVVVDYELQENNCRELSKIILRNAKRYKEDENKVRQIKPIPGGLLFVDCHQLKNLNLTYVYEKTQKFIEGKLVKVIYRSFTVLSFLLIPFFILKLQMGDWEWYRHYWGSTLIGKILYFFTAFIGIQIINPFIEPKKGQFKWAKWYEYVARIIVTAMAFGAARAFD